MLWDEIINVGMSILRIMLIIFLFVGMVSALMIVLVFIKNKANELFGWQARKDKEEQDRFYQILEKIQRDRS